jgi:hypothetical protein
MEFSVLYQLIFFRSCRSDALECEGWVDVESGGYKCFAGEREKEEKEARVEIIHTGIYYYFIIYDDIG